MASSHAHADAHTNGHGNGHHVAPVSMYLTIFGALMWGAYEAIWDTAKQNTEDKVNEIGT